MLKIISAIYIAVLIALSLFPLSGVQAAGNSDKIAHFIAYMILSVLFYFISSSLKQRLYLLIGAIAFGGIMETLQLFVPGREFSYYDMLANTAGALLGFGVSWMLMQSREQPRYGGCGSPHTTVPVKHCDDIEPK